MTVALPNINVGPRGRRAAAIAVAAAALGGLKEPARALSTLAEALVWLYLQSLPYSHLPCLNLDLAFFIPPSRERASFPGTNPVWLV